MTSNAIVEKLAKMGEYSAVGLYEQPDETIFVRKSRAIRRYFEKRPLPAYAGTRLYPSGPMPCDVEMHPFYQTGFCIPYGSISRKDQELSDALKSDFGEFPFLVPPVHTVAGHMWNHSMPNTPRICREGLDSYETRIRSMTDESLKKGLLDVLAGIRAFHGRCLALLEEAKAPEELIAALRQVPFGPAKDLYQALVCWNFVLYLDECDNLGSLVTGLAPYYRGEDVTDVLSNLFDNLDANGGYSMSLHTDYSPLTLQCLRAVKGRRRPMIELFVNEDTPQEIWDAAFESVRTGNGQPAFYSEKELSLLQRRFPAVRDEDLHLFCGGGCTEAMFAGLSAVGSLDAGINLPFTLEEVLRDRLTSCKTFDEFYDAYVAQVKVEVEQVTTAIARSQEIRSRLFPVPMRTLLVDDCIDKGMEYHCGGARYVWSIVNFAGMINVIDSLLFLKSRVFDAHDYTAEDVLRKLADNDGDFLSDCRNSSLHFGNDQPEANAMAFRLSSDVLATLDDKKTAVGDGFIAASIQFMSQVNAGRSVGATPDGREAGSPLCDSLAAIFGRDDKGPTALLNSVTSLNLEKMPGIPVLNFNVEPDFSPEILKALVLGYIRQGGLQMQLTCTDRKTLLEAYENPELHRNLVVRVGGYSEYFHRLSDELKRMVIQRSIQSIPGGAR